MKMISFKEMPSFSKPRERAKEVGISNLADYELLAIILGTGSKQSDVLDLAKELLTEAGSITNLLDMTLVELKAFNGIGDAKAISLLSALEIGKRAAYNATSLKKIKSLKDIYEYSKNLIGNEKQETLLAIFLDCTAKVIGRRIVSIGTLNSTAFHPRDVIKWALKHSAYGLVIVHNHPSGECLPSSEDSEATEDIVLGCKAVGIQFVDHIIIGKDCYYSFSYQKCFKV